MSPLVIDCLGQRCPLPILELARRIGAVEIGAELAIDADDPAAAGDIAAWCRMRRHEFLGPGDRPHRYGVRRLH